MAAKTIACACAAAALLAAPIAAANGRFPAASQLAIDPTDGKHMLMRTTYGLLESTDGGASWRWICEAAVGYGGVLDPAIAIANGGTLIAGLGSGVSTSTNGGCDWSIGGGPANGELVIDVSVSKGDPKRVVGVTSTGSLSGGTKNILVESHDGGATWSQSGVAIPTDFTAETIDVVANDTQRVYVSGFVDTADRVSAIEVSDDDGATWTRYPITIGGRDAAYIGAIDPNDGDRVYARLDGDDGDLLVVSDDAGKTWRQLYQTKGDMLGLALSPDGATIALGGPQDGLLVASTKDFAFAQASKISPACLVWTSAGLYACAAEYPDGFTVGVSTDVGKTFTPLYHLEDLAELDCPASSSFGENCPSVWPQIAQTLGVGEDDAGPPPPTPAASSSSCDYDTRGAALSWGAIVAPLAIVTALRARNRRRRGAQAGADRSTPRT